MMAPVIRDLDAKHYQAWDRFVLAAPDGTFFHQTGWRDVIERAFRHTSYYVFAEQDGAVTGVLPLFHVRSVLFGNRLLSVPFCVYGGPLAVDAQTAEALSRHAIELMRRLHADLVEFRMRDPHSLEWAARPGLYATFRKPIHTDPEQNLKAIPRKQRAVVRKALVHRLRSNVGQEVDGFYQIYAESVRNLGTPVFPRRYLRLLMERFCSVAEILTVTEDTSPLSAVLSFFFRDEVLPYYGAGRSRARELGAFDFMYWELMNTAARARAARIFDFGRSKVGTGSFAFKKNWGFSPQPLDYVYWLAPGQAIPDHNPLNPRYRAMIEVWKRLPLPVANWIGPPIVRGIG
jgi:FemAB-related protein (PEP-CTERM system-associated)